MNKKEAEEFIRLYANPAFDQQMTDSHAQRLVDCYYESIGGRNNHVPDYHPLPIRVSYKQIQGAQGKHYDWWELFDVLEVRTPAEGIGKAKRLLKGYFSKSYIRNVNTLEILLAGELKYPGLERPKWLPVSTLAPEERLAWERFARQAIIDLGYKPTNMEGDD